MNLHVAAVAVALMLATILPASADAVCTAHSGPNRTVLIELYTSEGCSSCPPAERNLSRLANTLDAAAAVVPLSLHVGYWDYLGWKDHFAQDRFAQRQNWLVRANERRTVYTPQFFVAGSEFRSWDGSLRDTVRRLNKQTVSATIDLHTEFSANNVLKLDALAKTHAGDDATALYLAVAENGISSKIETGENQGVTLTHDHVVRAWFGPFPLHDGSIQTQRQLNLPAAWQRDRLETIAFMQDEHTGSVLQALRVVPCSGT
jgi:hypothetical protein